MSKRTWPTIPPKRILLATDLSGRGDRALDRATQLATQWDAELLVVHALEGPGQAAPEYQGLPSWRRPQDTAATVEAQVREDVRGACPKLRVHVEEGPAIRVILDAVEREACDLVITGLGRQRPLGWPPVAKTIDELFRRSPVSVLVVKRRPHAAYAHVLVGTDFTDEARVGLEVAAQAFPQAMFAVMHAFEMPYRSLLLDTPLSRDFGEMEHATIAAFVSEAHLPDAMQERIVTLIEHGPPEAMLSAYVIERRADLTVIGAYERGRLFHTVVGGFGPRIVEAVPSDVLVVRARPGETSVRT
jgi:nucleotide-binding universal stress UspA family protein